MSVFVDGCQLVPLPPRWNEKKSRPRASKQRQAAVCLFAETSTATSTPSHLHLLDRLTKNLCHVLHLLRQLLASVGALAAPITSLHNPGTVKSLKRAQATLPLIGFGGSACAVHITNHGGRTADHRVLLCKSFGQIVQGSGCSLLRDGLINSLLRATHRAVRYLRARWEETFWRDEGTGVETQTQPLPP